MNRNEEDELGRIEMDWRRACNDAKLEENKMQRDATQVKLRRGERERERETGLVGALI